jgi:hypothetical protein
MGNSGEQEFLPQLKVWAKAEAEDPVLAEAAAWAIERLSMPGVCPEATALRSL